MLVPAAGASADAGSANFMRAQSGLRPAHREPDDSAEGLDEGALLADARLRALLRLASELVLEGVVLPERLRRSTPAARSTSSIPMDPARRRRQQALHPVRLLGRQVHAVRRRHRQPRLPQWWIDPGPRRLAKGYAGIYIDDVNLYRKVSNGLGQAVAPIDPRTGAAMSEPTWQRYLGDHMQGVRARVPDDRDRPQLDLVRRRHDRRPAAHPPRRELHQPRARRQRRRPHRRHGQVELPGAARLHRPSPRRGHAVVLDATSTTAAGRLYGLAAYFLINSGRDGRQRPGRQRPTDWWNGLRRRPWRRGRAALLLEGRPAARLRPRLRAGQ